MGWVGKLERFECERGGEKRAEEEIWRKVWKDREWKEMGKIEKMRGKGRR